MKKLTPYQEKLVKLRLSGMSLQQISEHIGRRYGTIRNDFIPIYKALDIKLLCELNKAWMDYEFKFGGFRPLDETEKVS